MLCPIQYTNRGKALGRQRRDDLAKLLIADDLAGGVESIGWSKRWSPNKYLMGLVK